MAFRSVVPAHPYALSSGSIYRSFVLGRTLWIVSDTRYHRTPESAADNAAKTMLGVEQREWLKQQLTRGAQYQAVFWVNSVPWISSTSAGWGSYAVERREIAAFIESLNSTAKLYILSGDMHGMALDDGTNNRFGPAGRALGPVVQSGALDRNWSYKGLRGVWAGRVALHSLLYTCRRPVQSRLQPGWRPLLRGHGHGCHRMCAH